ncbi:hypothetical protein SUGI_1133910 [Cryptomeria japonica]|nr:hypothetical protein SUGI_1133910 [Cryptomeria japonica]
MAPKMERNALQDIAGSCQLKLLLKQWMKEEEAICRRIALKEAHLDATRKQTTQLYIFYFLYHAVTLILMYTTVGDSVNACSKVWIPSLQSVVASAVMVLGMRHQMGLIKRAARLLEREKKDAKLLSNCIEELKTKGNSFDLLEEVESIRRAKGMCVGSNRDGGGGRGSGILDFMEKMDFGYWHLDFRIVPDDLNKSRFRCGGFSTLGLRIWMWVSGAQSVLSGVPNGARFDSW